MSLLIKALASAEKGKQAELIKNGTDTVSSAALALEPVSKADTDVSSQQQYINPAAGAALDKEAAFNAAADASLAKLRQPAESKEHSKQKAAANVFVANQSIQKSTSASTLFVLGAVGALIIWLGLEGYAYLAKPDAPAVATASPSPQLVAGTEAPPLPTPAAQMQSGDSVQAAAESAGTLANDSVQVAKSETASLESTATETAAFASTAKSKVASPDNELQPALKKKIDSPLAENRDAPTQNADVSKQAAPLKLVARTPPAGVDPTLQSAYQAYSRGDDAAAQQQYRQVLQSDTRNVDALLGMAAIALRQSRYADADGWYQKVLEIEPRNTVALSAIAILQINHEAASTGAGTADAAGNESRIKNMLAQQPEAASMHAALGNLYAAREQWTLAQAAYFDASRYAPNSADYAFNLAVSLDQLGKSALALAQYQRALDLLNHSGAASSLDKAQLEARIKALQQ